MMVPYILAAAATHAFSPVAGHAPNTRLQNTRVLRGGQAQASAGIPEAALAGLEPAEDQFVEVLGALGAAQQCAQLRDRGRYAACCSARRR